MASVTLTPVSPKGRPLTLQLEGLAMPGGGFSTWEEVDRRRREAGLEYAGTSARTYMLPVFLDGLDGGDEVAYGRGDRRFTIRKDVSVEPAIARLEEFARRTATTGEPPVLVVGGAAPGATGGRKWVIDSIEPGDYLLTGNAMRCQAHYVVNLKEFTPAEVLITHARTSKAHAKVKSAKVVRSDLPQGLPKFAQRVLGKSSRWKEIAALNKNRQGKVIRDPKDIYVGQELRYP